MYRGTVQNLGESDPSGNYDLVYYNADIINSNPTNTNLTSNPVVSFQESRNIPIIKNSREYEFSIVRFQVDGCGKNLPLFIPNILIGVENKYLWNDFVKSPLDGKYYILILATNGSTDPSLDPTHWKLFDFLQSQPSNNNPFVYKNSQVLKYQGTWLSGTLYQYVPVPNNKNYYFAPSNITAYSIGLSINYSDGSKYYSSKTIIYEPENTTAEFPPAPVTTQVVSNEYYYVYTYEHWVRLINITLYQCFNQLKTNLLTVGKTLTGYAPYMTYEASSGLFNMYYDTTLFGINYQSSGYPPINSPAMNLYCNDNFYGLFSSFNSISVALPVTYSFQNNTEEPNIFIVENKLNSNIWKPNAFTGFPTLANSYYKMAQNYVSTNSLWSPISSIVFTTGQLPILNETSSSPVKFGSANNNTSTIANNFSPVIADVALNLKRAEDYSNLIFYEPSGEYRMASMLGGSNGEIVNIDIQVFWKNRLDNKLYPLRMFNYSNVSMKMLFRKKKKNH